MSSPNEIRVALERSYSLALGEYERAEMPTETIVGLKALEAADRRIQARKGVLKEKMEKIAYLLRLQVDPEWTPHHLKPLAPRKKRRKGSIAKAAFQVLRRASGPMKTREISREIAGRLEVDVSDARALNQLDNAVRTSMKERVKDGFVEELEGRPTQWQVLSRPKWAPSNVPYVYADQLLIPEGTHRQIVVEVNFAGAPHRFTLKLVPSGTDFPVPTDIPAVPARTVQTMQRTPETWHWTDGPPPTRADGVPVIQ